MATVLLNNYLPQLWANMDDDKIDGMCAYMKGLLDYIQYGGDVLPFEPSEPDSDE